ncbi:putative short-subunit dehydrogenase-like oxidoreductase (DUF2520 family) [Chitinivorax tropicus]|uniref:Putative short-subunit dehydrogenase-like oxidoreductase (DUF2520 family) n=1 Tax=Chitinivorax tropicus TaxID=714531 RepID=A0A840MEN0_9PROT|nr:Rossmann-like and DUF2520 domain-containing protein [Chitinivorax tropicus]MBB5017138.1 putative short-subunit dehydrogenase-like oxidoreductase (DUF2520 family) [Chitinivorax tropicus]
MTTPPRLNVIGAGRAGRVMARLLVSQGLMTLNQVCNRELRSAQQAVAWLGSGRAVDQFSQLSSADIWLVATPDDQLALVATQLAALGILHEADRVFHLSGSHSADVLDALHHQTAHLASLHPLMSFANPDLAFAGFAGTYCAVEGSPAWADQLQQWATQLGGISFALTAHQKTLYHAGAVQACNHLVALLETSLQCFELAGMPRAAALQALQPLLIGTLNNVHHLGTAAALTGPIARGDVGVVAKHVSGLDAQLPQVALIYRQLGQVACELAAQQGGAAAAQLQAIRRLLGAGDMAT